MNTKCNNVLFNVKEPVVLGCDYGPLRNCGENIWKQGNHFSRIYT